MPRLAASRSSSSASHSAGARFARQVLRLQLDEGLGHAVELQGSEAGRWSDVSASIVFSSMEVAGATDVRVDYRRPVRGGGGPSAIEVVLQDGVDRGVGARADLERATAGGFEPLGAEAVGVPQDADRERGSPARDASSRAG